MAHGRFARSSVRWSKGAFADDRVFDVIRVSVILFVFALGLARGAPVGVDLERESMAPRSDPAPAQSGYDQWDPGGGRGANMVSPPESEYAIPKIDDSRYVWYKRSTGKELWGLVTEHTARDSAIAVIEHYIEIGGWELQYAEQMDLTGRAWSGILRNNSDGAVVAYFMAPSDIMLPSGDWDNPTRITVVRVDAEGAEEIARELVGAMPADR